MRQLRIAGLALFCLSAFFSPPDAAGQSTSPVPQASPFLRRMHAAMTGGARIKSSALTGSITLYGAAADASGTFSFTADKNGGSRFDVSGGLSEFRSVSGGIPSGSGIGLGGVYTVDAQNPMTTSAWFFPALSVESMLVARDFAKSYVGRETKDGRVVNHLQIWHQANRGTPTAIATVKQATVEDVYVDELTHMPVLVTFNLHTNLRSLASIPVQIHFSDYRLVQNCPIAYHIQVYMLGAPFWDIRVSSASLNY